MSLTERMTTMSSPASCCSLLLLWALFGFVEPQAETTLRQVHIIFRHGDRAPVNLYPNDPNEGHIWPFGLGQLTDVGKRQQYELGTFLRNRYDGFFSTNPQEIEVRSSDKDRCIASTQVNLAAFFKPDGMWVWNSSFLWQPVPIHTVPKAQDNLLNEDATCPASDKIVAKIMETPEGQAYGQKYHDLFEIVSRESGMTVNDPSSALDVYGTIFIEKLNNLIIPAWVTDQIWDNLTNAANEAFIVGYASRTYQRLRGGPLIGHMIKLMEKRREAGNSQQLPKGYMFSTHDAVIAAVLNAMNVFNGRTVPYCATILVELHQQGENYFVRTFYRNSSEHDPHSLKLPSCQVDCPLADFLTQLFDVTPVDIQEECHNKEEESDRNRSIFSSLTVPTFVILFVWYLLKR